MFSQKCYWGNNQLMFHSLSEDNSALLLVHVIVQACVQVKLCLGCFGADVRVLSSVLEASCCKSTDYCQFSLRRDVNLLQGMHFSGNLNQSESGLLPLCVPVPFPYWCRCPIPLLSLSGELNQQKTSLAKNNSFLLVQLSELACDVVRQIAAPMEGGHKKRIH